MDDRTFAVADRELPSIPWALIAPHEERTLRSYKADLDRIDRSGGPSVEEMLVVIEDREPYPITPLEPPKNCDDCWASIKVQAVNR